jgi:hypothetical protein
LPLPEYPTFRAAEVGNSTYQADPPRAKYHCFCFSESKKVPDAIGCLLRCAASSNAVWLMYRITTLVTAILLVSVLGATAERIKRKPPNEADRARLASEQVLNDGDLRTGDIISIDRGFFQVRGLNADGSYDLTPVRSPLHPVKAKGR